jgi:hypothetical protein
MEFLWCGFFTYTIFMSLRLSGNSELFGTPDNPAFVQLTVHSLFADFQHTHPVGQGVTQFPRACVAHRNNTNNP